MCTSQREGRMGGRNGGAWQRCVKSGRCRAKEDPGRTLDVAVEYDGEGGGRWCVHVDVSRCAEVRHVCYLRHQ
jgi:hypothetical protein